MFIDHTEALNSDLFQLSWLLHSYEILHGRWSMLAALGALIPELLDLTGLFQFVEPVWWRVGYSKLKVGIFHVCAVARLSVVNM